MLPLLTKWCSNSAITQMPDCLTKDCGHLHDKIWYHGNIVTLGSKVTSAARSMKWNQPSSWARFERTDWTLTLIPCDCGKARMSDAPKQWFSYFAFVYFVLHGRTFRACVCVFFYGVGQSLRSLDEEGLSPRSLDENIWHTFRSLLSLISILPR